MAQALVQVNLDRQAHAFCGEWTCAQIKQKPLPAFMPKVVKAGFPLPSFTAVFRYLNRCLADMEVPAVQRLLRSLLSFPPVDPAF